MNAEPTKAFYGLAAMVTIGLAVLFSGCNRRPQALVTGINLRDIDGIPAAFHGFYVADGITNIVHGSMKTNFSGERTIACTARSLTFEFVCEQRTPLGFELTVYTSDGFNRTSQGQYGIRGHVIFHKDGSDSSLTEPFTDKRHDD